MASTWTVTWPGNDTMDTLYDPNFTYHYDKVSCMAGAYWAHVVFCQLVFCSGILACECVQGHEMPALQLQAPCIVFVQMHSRLPALACSSGSLPCANLFLCAVATRVVPQLKWTHVWWGRLYIISMLWATGRAPDKQTACLPACRANPLPHLILASAGRTHTRRPFVHRADCCPRERPCAACVPPAVQPRPSSSTTAACQQPP